MKKARKSIALIMIACLVMLVLSGCQDSSSSSSSGEDTSSDTSDSSTSASGGSDETTTIKITWWGGQERHELTQEVLDLYVESHPNITFETLPAGWDGYFEKLSTQAASGSMPDIVQMDYLYISTYAKNGSLADLQPYIDSGVIDTSSVDDNILQTGNIDGSMAGMVLSTSILANVYNPTVLEEAGVDVPTDDWTWSDYVTMNNAIKEATDKYGSSLTPIDDTNIFNYWVRQHGESLFSDDDLSLGYDDDSICADFFSMWKELMDNESVPNPDEYAQISTLGSEAAPVVTDDAGMTISWNNYPATVSSVNSSLQLVTPPLSDDSSDLGLWLKPGMFFSVASTSKVKDAAAEFINWFINSKEANEIMLGERGTPVSSEIRDDLIDSGLLSDPQIAMFNYVDESAQYCGETPSPDPAGISEVNDAFANAATQVFYGQMSADEAAASFREKANEILARNNS